jgi:DNA helicase-2/ATP-dependent DNA helicase PcrA
MVYMEFDKRQTGVIHSDERNILIPAAPGSGKSTTLCELTTKLVIEDKIPSSKISIFMFNVEARKSFVQKLMNRTNLPENHLPQVKTFHSLGGGLCHSLSARGFLPQYDMFSNEGQVTLLALRAITSVIGREKWNKISNNDNQAMDCFLQYVDLVKSNDIAPRDVLELLNLPPSVEFFESAFEKFEELRKDMRKRTYADLIRDPYLLLSNDKPLAKRVGNQRDYIAVDEAQDMNHVQYGLFKIVAGDKARTALIGDNDQTIYSWRGSDPSIMSHMYSKDFANVKTLGLSKTYRYGHELALASSYCIDNNKNRLPNVCVAQQECNETTINVHPTRDEGRVAADIIKDKLNNHGAKYKDIAILCRLYSSAAPVELALLENGIPTCISGGRSVLASKEALLLKAILTLASGDYQSAPQKDRKEIIESLLRLPSMAIKHNDIEKIADSVSSQTVGIGYHISRCQLSGLSKYQTAKISDRSFAITAIEKSKPTEKAHNIIQAFAKTTDLFAGVGKGSLTKKGAIESEDILSSLISFIKRLDTSPSGALAEINRLVNASNENSGNKDAVLITSIYQAKGLDYDYVFIPGLSDSRFPHQLDSEFAIDHGMEEERRLFYVGITRAIKEVHLLCPNDPEIIKNLKTGNRPLDDYGSPKNNASRFIFELNLKRAKDLAEKLHAKKTFKPSNSVEEKYLAEYEN